MSEAERDSRKELLHLYTTNYQTFYGLLLAVAVVLLAEAELLTSPIFFHYWYFMVVLMFGTIGGGAGVFLNGFYWARMTHGVIMNPRSCEKGLDTLTSLHTQYVALANDRKDKLGKLYKRLNFDKGSGKAIVTLSVMGGIIGAVVSVILLAFHFGL